MKIKRFEIMIVVIIIFSFIPIITKAECARIPHHYNNYYSNSGLHSFKKEYKEIEINVYSEVIRVSGAPWIRLFFNKCNLGRCSYILITSLEDGASQTLNAKSLKQWHNSSAFFNGDAVSIELILGPSDRDIFIEINKVMVGERVNENVECQSCNDNIELEIESICGDDDDRTPSNDPAVGRLVPVGCTAWIASNGSYLTAGHCAESSMQVLQFNVPLSDDDGTINNPGPSHQYIVDTDSIRAINGGLGNDWAVFMCYSNSTTKLLPVEAQKSFFRLSRDSDPSAIRITGFGVDDDPPGSTGRYNQYSQTQQTHSGLSLGEVVNSAYNAYWKYRVDTRGGNSGSPVQINGTDLSVGIHTHGGCHSTGGYNKGTSFENDNLENAVQTFPDPIVCYVDKGHPIDLEDGTVCRPYDQVIEGVTSITSGGLLSIVKGEYNESLTINKAMTIVAPVGKVTIGPTSLSKPFIANQNSNKIIKQDDNLSEESLPEKFSISQNYPNPFNLTTTINYSLKKDCKAILKIYNTLGQEIKTLINDFQPAGYKSITWDGTNDDGKFVPSGIYIYRIIADEFEESHCLILLK